MPDVDPARRELILSDLRFLNDGELPDWLPSDPAAVDSYVAAVSADVDAGVDVPWSEDGKRQLAGLLRPYVRPR